MLCLIVAPLLLSWRWLPRSRVSPWENHAGLRVAVEQFVSEQGLARDGDVVSNRVVYTYAEPAVFFHLRRLGVPAAPLASLDGFQGQSESAVLLWGPQAQRLPEFRDRWAARRDEFEELGTWEFPPSGILRMNWAMPNAVAGDSQLERLHAVQSRP